jgi:hypothetical protein
MGDELGDLVQSAANSLVSAMATDSWEAVKRRFAAVARRDRQLDATRRKLSARSGSRLERAKSEQARVWADILQDLLDEDPGKAQALQDFLASLGVAEGPAPKMQYQRAQGGPTVFGDVTGNAGNVNVDSAGGDVNIGSGKIVKRRFTFFLSPVFSPVVEVVKAHVVVSTVTVVVAIGGTSAGLALAHKGANTPAPSPTVAASMPAVPPPAQASADWGALQGGPARTGDQSDETRIGTGNVSKLSQVRTYKTNFGSTAPLIANGILYVATNRLYAFDATGASGCLAAPATCTPLWTAPTAYIHGMAIANGEIFVTDGEGVQAFSAAGSENCSGTPKVCAPLWATSTTTATGPAFEPGPGSPVVANGVLYVPGYGDGIAPNLGGAYVAAFDAAGTTGCSGTPTVCVPMWTTSGLPVSSGNEGSPAIADGVLYIANGATLDAFGATGSAGCSGVPKVCAPLWTGAMSGNETGTAAPAVAHGIVYVGNPLSGLYAVDAAGSRNCSATATGKTCAPLWNAPSALDGSALAVANGVVYDTGSGKLSAFDATASTNCPGTGTVQTCTRAPLWTSAALTSGYLTSSPTVANGVVYVSSSGGGMYAYDAAGSLECSVSGTAKACSPLWGTPGPGFTGGGSPAIVNGILFINVTGNGTIYAYSL